MTVPEFFDRVLFVIVLYKKNLESSSAYRSLSCLHHVNRGALSLFVYDNSDEASAVPANIHYVHDGTNAGVSKAYNQAALYARSKSIPYLMLMDQDSTFPLRVFDEFAKTLCSEGGPQVIVPRMLDTKGLVSPFYFIGGKGFRKMRVAPGTYPFHRLRPINSGMLIQTKTFFDAGGFDEAFPLDLSDIVFTERLAALNVKFHVVNADAVHDLTGAYADAGRFQRYLTAFSLYRDRSRFTAWFLGALPLLFRQGLKKLTFL